MRCPYCKVQGYLVVLPPGHQFAGRTVLLSGGKVRHKTGRCDQAPAKGKKKRR